MNRQRTSQCRSSRTSHGNPPDASSVPGGAAEVADIDETVVPDGKLATRVRRAGERNEIARGSLPKVQQAHHTDESKGLEDPQNVPHRVRTTNIGHNDGVEVGGDVAGTRRDIEVKK